MFYFPSIGSFNHARKTDPLSMRHSILIKTRNRLNGSPAPFLSREILHRNSGSSPGLQGHLRPQETAENNLPPQYQNTFISNSRQTSIFLSFRRTTPRRKKTDFLHPLSPRIRRNGHGRSALPSMTQNLPSTVHRPNIQRFSPAFPHWEKTAPPSSISSETPPFPGPWKGGVFVVETEN